MSALRNFATSAADGVHAAIIAATTSGQLDQAVRSLWRDYADGLIAEEDAAFLQSCVDRQRPAAGRASARPINKILGCASRFTPRQRPRRRDREASRDRRRMLGGSSSLPPQLRQHYTEGQRAVLAIIAGEIKQRRFCDLLIDKIAALAGVCRTTVQTTLHEARRLSHLKITERPQRGRKSLTNILHVISAEWLTWIKRGPSGHRPIGSSPPNLVNTAKNRKKLSDEENRFRSHANGSSEAVAPYARSAGTRGGPVSEGIRGLNLRPEG
jgi:hypothetical protein